MILVPLWAAEAPSHGLRKRRAFIAGFFFALGVSDALYAVTCKIAFSPD